jgi:hypothetical protein
MRTSSLDIDQSDVTESSKLGEDDDDVAVVVQDTNDFVLGEDVTTVVDTEDGDELFTDDDSSDSEDDDPYHHGAVENCGKKTLPDPPPPACNTTSASSDAAVAMVVVDLDSSSEDTVSGGDAFRSKVEALVARFPLPPTTTTTHNKSPLLRPSWSLAHMGSSSRGLASLNEHEGGTTWTQDNVVIEEVDALHRPLFDALYGFAVDTHLEYPVLKEHESNHTGGMYADVGKLETPEVTKEKVRQVWLAVHRALFPHGHELGCSDLTDLFALRDQPYVAIQSEFDDVCEKIFDAQGAASMSSSKTLSSLMKKSKRMGMGLLQKAMDGGSSSDGTGAARSDNADVRPSSFMVNFNHDAEKELLPCKNKLFRKLMLTNVGGRKAVYRIHILRPPEDQHGWYEITVRPDNGVLKSNAAVEIEVTLSVLRGNCNFHPIMAIDVEAAPRRFVLLQGSSEPSVFGVEPEELPQEPVDLVVDGQTVTAEIPSVLTMLHSKFVDRNGVNQEGIFRLAPDEWDVHAARSQLNRGDLSNSIDAVCIANMIKIWFRELPQRLLSSIPDEKLMTCEKEEDAVKCISTLCEYKVPLPPSCSFHSLAHACLASPIHTLLEKSDDVAVGPILLRCAKRACQ